jgi:hypothetical protein
MAKIPEYPSVPTASITDTDLFLMDESTLGTRKVTVAQMKAVFGATPAADTIAPVLQSIAVNNSDPSSVVLTYNESLDTASIPLASAYGVAGKTVSGVSIVGPNVFLAVSVPYVTGAAVTVTYTPGAGPVRDLAHNNAVGFISLPGVNNVGTSTGGGGTTLTIGNF